MARKKTFKPSLEDIASRLPKFEHERGHYTSDGDTGSAVYYSGHKPMDRIHATFCESYGSFIFEVSTIIFRKLSDKKREFIFSEVKDSLNWTDCKITSNNREALCGRFEYIITSQEDLDKAIEAGSKIAELELE